MNVSVKKMFLALALLAIAPAAHAVDVGEAFVDFGSISVQTGFPQTQFVTLTNSTSEALGPLEVVSNCFVPDFDVGTACDYQTLQPGQACQINITFKPSHVGFFDCTIRIAAQNAPGESDIQVQGQGTNP